MSGFTNVPNDLIDSMIDNANFANQTRIYMLVFRYTVCFHREYHELSLSFMAERLKMMRNNVAREVKKMLDLKLIQERTENGKRYLSIGEGVLISDNGGGIKSDNTSVLKSDTTAVLKSEYQENNNIKLTNKNNNDQTLFDRFWKSYPRKVSKPQAIKAFQTAIKKTDIETLIFGLEAYKDHILKNKTDTQFIKHPSTWLNAEGWNDYKPAPSQESTQLKLLKMHSRTEMVGEDEHYERLLQSRRRCN